MDFDLEDLISSDAADNAKAGAKYQPKAKPKPKPRGQPRPKSTPIPSSQSIVGVAVENNESTDGKEEEQFRNNGNQISEKVNGDWQSSFGKMEGENADVFLGLESFDDFHTSTTTIEIPVPVSVDENAEKRPGEPDLGNITNACSNLENSAQLDPLTGEGAAIFTNNGDLPITMGAETNNLECGQLKVAQCLHSLEPLDILSESITSSGPSGPRVCKFKPKPKIQAHKEERNAVVPNQDAVESVSCPENLEPLPSQADYIDDRSFPSYAADDILDLSSIDITVTIPTDTIPDDQSNEAAINSMEASQMDFATGHPEGLKSTKRAKRKTRNGLSPIVEQEKASKSGLESKAVRSLGQSKRRTNKTLELIDESENEGLGDDFVHENEDNHHHDGHEVESESLCDRKGSTSKKSIVVKDKPIRKRRKANEVPVESKRPANKKFSHRTRRNKRQVNPDLLKIPEDELDFHNLPMKELIRLAEHRERLAKKEASALPAQNQSAGSFSNHYIEDEEAYDPEYSMEPQNATFYNYGTHMRITPRMKWSKQDTELFYEAIQQFGTDLSMIKECFPGRTREQIKSKYKKEERQHPSRLHDALTTRAKGHSHFEVVIERLKQAQGQDSDKDEPINMTDEEDEEAVAADMINQDEAATKPEQLDKEVQTEPNSLAVESPTKADDSEDDMFLWSQYRSDT